MQTISIALSAGVPVTVFNVNEYFHLLETTAGVNIDFLRNGQIFASASSMEGGFFSRPANGFTSLIFTSATAQTIKIATASGAGGYQRTAGTVNVINTQGSIISDATPVTVGVTATPVAAATPTTKSIRFFNNGTADIFLGGAGVTTINGAIKLPPGGLYIESESAAAAWYAISGIAGQNLRVQAVS